MTATYTKLQSGEWGLRIEGDAEPGQSVAATKKSGEIKTETIGQVVWAGNGISLCTIAGKAVQQDYPGKMCPRCGSEPLDNALSCWECGYKGH